MDAVINYVRRIVPATETEFLVPATPANGIVDRNGEFLVQRDGEYIVNER